MIGAIAGDIIGSIYEFDPIKTKDFPLFSERSFFTDDSVLTCAVALAIMKGRPYRDTILELGRRYPDLSYGGNFRIWLASDNPQPYNSWGNGSAMRVSPIGFAFDTEEAVLREARKSAEITHNHPEGIKGAQAAALAILLARKGANKDQIRRRIGDQFEYELNRTVDDVRPDYSFNESCQGTVPEAIIAFLDSESYEDAIRNTISLGGDADTLGAITGGIAEAFYGGVPDTVRAEAKSRLPPDLNDIVDRFYKLNNNNQKSKRGRDPMSDQVDNKKKFQKKTPQPMPWIRDTGIDDLSPGGFIVICPGNGDFANLMNFPSGVDALRYYAEDLLPDYLDQSIWNTGIEEEDADNFLDRIRVLIKGFKEKMSAEDITDAEVIAQLSKIHAIIVSIDYSAQIFYCGRLESVLKEMLRIARRMDEDYGPQRGKDNYDGIDHLLEADDFDDQNPDHFELAKSFLEEHISDVYRPLHEGDIVF